MFWPKREKEFKGACWPKYPKHKIFQKVEPKALAFSAGIERSYGSDILCFSRHSGEVCTCPWSRSPRALVSAKNLMTLPETIRNTAAPIGRIMYFNASEEIGLLYQWGYGKTQVTLFSDWDLEQTITEFDQTTSSCP